MVQRPVSGDHVVLSILPETKHTLTLRTVASQLYRLHLRRRLEATAEGPQRRGRNLRVAVDLVLVLVGLRDHAAHKLVQIDLAVVVHIEEIPNPVHELVAHGEGAHRPVARGGGEQTGHRRAGDVVAGSKPLPIARIETNTPPAGRG